MQCIDRSYPWSQMTTAGHNLSTQFFCFTHNLSSHSRWPTVSRSLSVQCTAVALCGSVSPSHCMSLPLCFTVNHHHCLPTRLQYTSSYILSQHPQSPTMADCFPLALSTVYCNSSLRIRRHNALHVFTLLFPHPTTLSRRHPHSAPTTNNAPRTDSTETHMPHVSNCRRQPCFTH
jgi:hypothetical protein